MCQQKSTFFEEKEEQIKWTSPNLKKLRETKKIKMYQTNIIRERKSIKVARSLQRSDAWSEAARREAEKLEELRQRSRDEWTETEEGRQRSREKQGRKNRRRAPEKWNHVWIGDVRFVRTKVVKSRDEPKARHRQRSQQRDLPGNMNKSLGEFGGERIANKKSQGRE